jgi:hypothetical protein
MKHRTGIISAVSSVAIPESLWNRGYFLGLVNKSKEAAIRVFTINQRTVRVRC